MSDHLKEKTKAAVRSLASCIYSQPQRMLLIHVHILLKCIFVTTKPYQCFREEKNKVES